MKKVIYKLKFVFKSFDTNQDRDDKLNSLLSKMEDIDTENPIISPNNGSIIVIDGEDYEVSSKKYSFVTEGDFVFYITIVELENIKAKHKLEKDKNEEYLLSLLNSLKLKDDLSDKLKYL